MALSLPRPKCLAGLLAVVGCLALSALWPRPAMAADKDDAEVVLNFWNILVYDPPRIGVNALIEKFNEEHPTIHVELLDVPQMEQKLLTAIAGRVPPDIALFDRFRTANYAERGAFMTLDDLAAKRGIRSEDFFEAPWGECIYRDELYAIPFNSDVRVLFYNKDLFAEAGLDPERPPRNWRELREYSERLIVRDENGRLERVGFVPYYGFGNTWLYLFGWQKGVQYLSDDGLTPYLDDPRLVEALAWTRDFSAMYGVEALNQFASGFGVRELDSFLSGKVAMTGDEVFMLSRIRRYAPDLNFGIAPIPWPEDGQRASWSGGFAFVVPTGCPHPEEAMEFIAYMVREESQALFGKRSAQLPANRRATRDPFFSEDPNWRAMVAEMEYSYHRPVTPVGGVMWNELARAWERGSAGVDDPRQLLETANREVQAELDRIAGRRQLPLVDWTTVTGVLALILGAGLAVKLFHTARQMRSISLRRREAYAGYVFSLPVIIGLAVFVTGPILVALVYSFCDYDVLRPARWTGLTNYERMLFEDPLFWTSMWNTIFFTVFAVPTSLLGSMGLALLLNAPIRGRSFWRTLFYLPSIVPIVAMSLLFLWLFNGRFGLFNVFLQGLGLPPAPWLTSPNWSKPSLVLMNMWTVGAGMIIFLAGLQGIPRHLYESAMIDGANTPQRFLNVTIPMLSPTIFFMLVINTIGAFQIFTQAYLMSGGTGSPLDSTLFYVFYLFRQGFENFAMGYASAMAWVMFLLILLVTLGQFFFAKRWVYEEARR